MALLLLIINQAVINLLQGMAEGLQAEEITGMRV